MSEEKKHNELDLLSLIGKVLKEWKLLFLFTFVGGVLGVFIALCMPKFYKADVVLAPEFSSGGVGLSDNLADLASSFGVDIGGKSNVDAIYPDLYPEIFTSTDFIMNLYDVPVRLKDNDEERTYYDHLTHDLIMPFWDKPKLWLQQKMRPKEVSIKTKGGKADTFKITRKDYDIVTMIGKSILCDVDKKTSVISIGVIDQDPLVAAIIADTLQQRLQHYITDYRTNKARIDVEHYRSLATKAKADYEKVRQQYISFSDANQDVILMSVKSKIEDLENDMQLRYNVYTQATAQFKMAEAKLQERTPAFTMLKRPMMTHKPASTPKIVVVLMFVVGFWVLDAMWVLFIRGLFKKNPEVEEADDILE